jgi:phosphoglycerol transferase MdoB-like AlkP superfamily enzyme
MFSLSSHKPFDYPQNKINYYDKAPVQSFANSIKYADYSLGKFYDKLKENNFFNDGTLAMVADHNAHIYGDTKVPVNIFKIPALIISKDIQPREINSVTHQVDIAPTLLDISGVSSQIPAMGVNLNKSDKSRAVIIHHNSFAYLVDDKFVLFQENIAPQMYNLKYKKIDNNSSMIKDGLKYIYQSYYLYSHEQFK